VTSGDEATGAVELPTSDQRDDPGELVHFSDVAPDNPVLSVWYPAH